MQELKALLAERNEAKLKEIITENPEVLDQTDDSGTSLFLYLVYYGLTETFSLAKTKKLAFSFHEAIIVGDLALVKSKLSDNTELIESFSPDGFTPITLAAFFDQTEIAEFLLSKGAKPETKAKNPNMVNALHAALAKENEHLCRLFLESGMDVNLTQMQNVTALHSAAKRGNLNLVKLLLEFGADASIKMKSGETALDIAKQENKTDIIDLLKV